MPAKVRLGKLPTAADLAMNFIGYINQAGFELLAISAEHAIRAGLLPGTHKDPFDRMLIAQTQSESISMSVRNKFLTLTTSAESGRPAKL